LTAIGEDTMALISQSIPNIVNGVSQQPPAYRLVTQGEIQENGLSSVVDGLSKRPSSENIAFLADIDTVDSAFIHTARRDESEAYNIIVYDNEGVGVIKVFDQAGVEKTVTVEDTSAQTYINSLDNPKENLAAVSIADFTYILNKNQVVAMDTATSAIRYPDGIVYIKDVDYSSTFSITITKGSTSRYLAFKTKSATQDSTAAVHLAESGASTDVIANHFYDFFRNSFSTSTYYEGYSYSSAGLPANMGVSLIGSVIYFYNTNGDTTDFTIDTNDSFGGEHVKPYKDKTASFTKLPPMAPEDFKILINGDNEKGQDDYWVKYSENVWEETIAPSTAYLLDAATLPMTLRKDETGNFHLEETVWAERKAGDETTNPDPSFIDYTLSDIFFYKDRLGFLSDENVIFSRSGSFEAYDFFRKTTLTIVDSDPIDVAVSSNKVSLLKHAVPFSDSLLLFSELTQFKVRSDTILTPETINISNTTEFEASLTAKPQAIGKFVYFASRRGEFGSLWEYFIDTDTDANDAIEVTSHIPSYIEGEVFNIQASSNDNTLIVQSEGDRNSVYIYRFYWAGNDKVQSAWSKWTFSGEVLNCEFNKSELNLLVNHTDGIYLEKIRFTEDEAKAYTSGFSIHLDRRFILTEVGQTAPYTDENIVYVTDRGQIIEAAYVQDALAEGTVVFGGLSYTFRYRFSEPFMKNNNQPVLAGSLRIKNYSIYYSNTAFFKVKIIPLSRIASGEEEFSYDKVFNGRVIGLLSNALDSSPTETGLFRASVLARSSAVAIELENDSHFPSIFQGVDWEADYTIRSQRV
jgi:hypothetical protein